MAEAPEGSPVRSREGPEDAENSIWAPSGPSGKGAAVGEQRMSSESAHSLALSLLTVAAGQKHLERFFFCFKVAPVAYESSQAGLGVELELQSLAYTTATATLNPKPCLRPKLQLTATPNP